MGAEGRKGVTVKLRRGLEDAGIVYQTQIIRRIGFYRVNKFLEFGGINGRSEYPWLAAERIVIAYRDGKVRNLPVACVDTAYGDLLLENFLEPFLAGLIGSLQVVGAEIRVLDAVPVNKAEIGK